MSIFGRKGPSGFSASSTAEEVTHGIDGTGLTAIVTGASSGIGAETSHAFALRGIHVIMAVRNTESGLKVKEAIVKEKPEAKIDVMELDLSSMASVRKFAQDYNSLGLPLNLLMLDNYRICEYEVDNINILSLIIKLFSSFFFSPISNNAGVVSPPFTLSQDNIELQFATNHLGHFLLTNLLLETMKRTSRESHKEGRIVNVSSMGHTHTYNEGIQFDKINDKSRYSAWRAYGQSKLANILHANELAKHFKEEGVEITANSLHPGVVTSNALRHVGFVNALINWVCKYLIKNPQQGAATTCYVALHPQVKGVSGEYFVDSNIATASSLAKDEELAKKLWDFSSSLTTSE